MSELENKNVTPASSEPKKTKEKKTKVKGQSRISKFFKDYKSEMKKIVWPSRETTLKSTCLVIVSLVVSAAAMGIIDFGASKLIELLIDLAK